MKNLNNIIESASYRELEFAVEVLDLIWVDGHHSATIINALEQERKRRDEVRNLMKDE
tara:strand:- start:1956 stop:2129 length:174 start_codon:yes stop_codon:yes gene_type:complete